VIPIARMLRRLSVFPLFGRGQTQLQPAYVEDVAGAIARVMQNTQSPMCYELALLWQIYSRCLRRVRLQWGHR